MKEIVSLILIKMKGLKVTVSLSTLQVRLQMLNVRSDYELYHITVLKCLTDLALRWPERRQKSNPML